MRMMSAVACFTCLWTAGPVRAAPTPATSADMAFFAGLWATGQAPVDGYETISAQAPDCARAVQIEAGSGNEVVRSVTQGDGAKSATTFRVMRFAGNYPWWPVDGGPGPVARKVDADSFDLAPIQVGRADWARAIRHYRCPAAAD